MRGAGVVKALVLAAVVLAVVVATVVSRQARTSRESNHPAPRALPPAPPASASEDRTVAGARTAALRYLALAEAVVGMAEDQAVAAQRDAATAATADALVAELRDKLARLRQGFPVGALSYRVGPLAARASMRAPNEGRVEIWYVGVVIPEGAPSWEEWRLARYDLAFERHAWRVAAEASGPGPRPGPQTTPDTMEAALTGFTSVLAPAP